MKERKIANMFSPLSFNWKRRNINKNGGISLKWAVYYAFYIISGTLNY